MKRGIWALGVIALVSVVAAVAALYSDAEGGCGGPAGYAIVYGNKVELDGAPSPRLKARLDAARALSLTSQNARRLIEGDPRVVAVTQRFHVSRAKLSLRNAGFSDVGGCYPGWYELRDVYSSLREIPAWLEYWLMGR